MLIASPEFPLVFLPFLVVYWLVRRYVDLQKLLLLLFGYAIYTLITPWFSLTLIAFTIFIGLMAEASWRSTGPLLRRALLATGVAAAIGLLAFFKYANFFSRQVAVAVELMGLQWALPVVDVLMPLGISFYVFQAISYLVCIHQGSTQPAQPLDLGLYLCFMPTLIAGPLCRPSELLTPLSSPLVRRVLDGDQIQLLICSFIIKKVWLASWLDTDIVSPVFGEPLAHNGFELSLGAVAYAFQIYFDFSGYTDLATAIALSLGYTLPVNFSFPYLANSLSDFWGRWHITLSRWIRDYIYIPLGGNRHGAVRMYANLMIAMILSGLWHGAGLKYLIWGALHGLFLSLEKILQCVGIRRFGSLLTFILVCSGWIFFRAPTLDAAIDYFRGCLDWRLPLDQGIPHLQLLLLIPTCFLIWSNAPLLLALCRKSLALIPPILRPVPIATVITFALALSPEGMPNFIYAQF